MDDTMEEQEYTYKYYSTQKSLKRTQIRLITVAQQTTNLFYCQSWQVNFQEG